MSAITELVLNLSAQEARDLHQNNEVKLHELENLYEAKFVLRGDSLKIIGSSEETERAANHVRDVFKLQRRGGRLNAREFKQALRHATRDQRPGDPPVENASVDKLFMDSIQVPLRRKRLTPITAGQKYYVDMIRKKDITFGIGPAGTGKTYLAVAMAVNALMNGEVGRMILCRPAVEAGEKLGFLPGDLKDKLDPYVRPLYDALYEMMEGEKVQAYLETGVIEIAPLAFMRGRTLNNAFVILDEAQNTTPEQMKMFLTRLGFESKAVVTGDASQTDLPGGMRSGLIQVQEVLGGLDDVAFCRFDERDVVRHELVMKIVKAYESWEARRDAAKQSE